jgi:hypothetical protein
LEIVSAETGHILHDNRADLSVLNHLLHPTEIGTVKIRSRVSVIYKELQIFEMIFASELI